MLLKTPSKAEVISNAHQYIKDLEAERARLLAEANELRQQVAGLRSLVNCENCEVLKYLDTMQQVNGMPAC